MAQTMLLTKPLSTFLASNTTPTLYNLLLLSPTGKLLSSSSPSSASTLRTQATLACSLWTLYHPFSTTTSPLVTSSLPPPEGNETPSPTAQDLNSITVQLEFGVMCVRSLKSGLLFVAIGPSTSGSGQAQHGSQYLQQIGSRHTSPPSSPNAQLEGHSQVSLQEVGTGSEVGSVGTERGGASIWGVRRQAEDVGRFLEGAMEGFVMSAAER